MRSKVSKALRKRFASQMKRHFPGFGEIAVADSPQGWPVFELQVLPLLSVYIVLVVFRAEDRFTIDVAWSRQHRFPSSISYMFTRYFDQARIRAENPKDGEFRFRLHHLWQPGDFTWNLVPRKSLEEQLTSDEVMISTGSSPPEESVTMALGKVNQLVDDAIDKIREYLLPYLDQIAESQTHRTGEVSARARSQ